MSFWDISFTDLLNTGASLGGAYLAYDAAGNAADAQAQAADNSAQVQQNMYNQTREDYASYRDIGQNSLYNLASLGGVEYAGAPGTIQDRYDTAMSRFQASPDYQFRLSQGIDAIDKSAAARGMLQSGAQSKALNDYAQNTASSEYGNYYNRLSNLAGLGQTAVGGTANASNSAASGISNALTNAGTARASGYIGQNNAIMDAANNLSSYYGYR